MKLIEFKKVAEMLAKEYKISVERGDRWAANIKKKIVFYVKNDVNNLPEEHILGFLLHETAHIHYTTDVKPPMHNAELHHTTLNMLEDISIENIIGKDYPNAGEILESTKEEVLDKLMQILPTLEDISLHEKALLYAAARFEGRGYAKGTTKYEIIGNKIAEIMEKNRTKILERKETKDLIPIVDEIIKLLLNEAEQLTRSELEKMQQEQKHEMQENITGQNAAKKKIIEQMKSGTGWKGMENMNNKIEFIDSIADTAREIGKRLRTVLKRNNAMEFGGRYRTGKLMAKRIIRIKANKDRNPFARRIIKSNQSYAFAVASDISGSMNNTRKEESNMSYAMTSLFMVGEALRIAGIKRSMIIFGRKAVEINNMDKKQLRWEEITNEKKIRKANDSFTDIGEAIDKCREKLENTKAERKIMIVLTDGSSGQIKMERMHKMAVKKGIECIGITIGNYANAMDVVFGKKNKTIEDTRDGKQIGKTFIEILKESIKKSI
jgi:hypothetical protein